MIKIVCYKNAGDYILFQCFCKQNFNHPLYVVGKNRNHTKRDKFKVYRQN